MQFVTILIFAALGSGVAPPTATRNQDPVVQKLLEEIVEFNGGRKNLTRRKHYLWKGKRTITNEGATGDFTVSCWVALPGCAKQMTVGTFDGEEGVTVTGLTINGRSWIARNKVVYAQPKENPIIWGLDGAYYCSLLPLLDDKAIRLKFLPERKVRGKPAFGFQVRCLDRATMSLYFDKKTRRLRLIEDTVSHSGKEYARLIEYTDYKLVHGIPWAMKQEVRAGTFYECSIKVEEVKLLDKIDPKIFANP